MTNRIMMWLCLALAPVTIWFNLDAGMPVLAVIHAAVCIVAALNWRDMDRTDRAVAELDEQVTEAILAALRPLPAAEVVYRHDQPQHPAVKAVLCAAVRERIQLCGCEGDPS